MLSEQVLPGCRGELHGPQIYYSEDLSGTVASVSEVDCHCDGCRGGTCIRREQLEIGATAPISVTSSE